MEFSKHSEVAYQLDFITPVYVKTIKRLTAHKEELAGAVDEKRVEALNYSIAFLTRQADHLIRLIENTAKTV